MGRSGQLPDLTFRPAGVVPVQVEVVDLVRLFAGGAVSRVGPHRTDFHSLFCVTGGDGTHEVDFVHHAYRPATVLWTRPGAVQRFREDPAVTGHAVLFTALAAADGPEIRDLLRPSAACTAWELPPADAAVVAGLLTVLRSTGPAAAARYALSALLLHLSGVPARDGPATAPARDRRSTVPVRGGASDGRTGAVVTLFAAHVEEHFRERLTARRAAAALGWSPRTLVRACLAGLGRTPKEVIDARVLLEARRLLVHTDRTVAEIGRGLGFTDPAAFGLFFRRLDGTTPASFRRRQTATG